MQLDRKALIEISEERAWETSLRLMFVARMVERVADWEVATRHEAEQQAFRLLARELRRVAELFRVAPREWGDD